MKPKVLRKIERDVTEGLPELRLRNAEEAGPRLQRDLARLHEKAVSLLEEFKTRMEARSSRYLNDTRRPFSQEEDVREARLYDAVAVILMIAELGLAFYIATVFDINPIFLLLLSLVAIFALKAGVLAILRDDLQPQRVRRHLLHWVIIPSLVMLLLAFVGLVFARPGDTMPLLMLSVINLCLCLLSLGCLGLTAGLFALTHHLKWSRYAEERFDAIEHEASETQRILQRVEKVIAELQPASQSLASNVNYAMRKSLKGSSIWVPLVLLVALSAGGCNQSSLIKDAAKRGPATQAMPALVQPQPPAPNLPQPIAPAADGMLLEIWLDWSLSAASQAYSETVSKLITALPEIAAKHQITRVAAYQFSNDGWNAAEIMSLNLPPRQLVATSEGSKIFGGLGKKQEQQARQQHLEQVREKLTALTAEKLLPQQTTEPPCTDLQGVFRRIAESTHSQQRLILLLTDGHETCSRQLQPVSFATAKTAVVIVILPEEKKTKAPKPPAQAWDQRRAEIAQAMPSAVIVPSFSDLTSAANEAIIKCCDLSTESQNK